jgi:uncharacterized protein (UPF0332 family)
MITEFLQKAHENLEDARVAVEQQRWNAAANRAYYAAYQAAIAALATEGMTKANHPHSWVQAQFSGILIQRRKLYASTMKSYLMTMQRLRDAADYSPIMVSKNDARTQLKHATELISSIARRLNYETQS